MSNTDYIQEAKDLVKSLFVPDIVPESEWSEYEPFALRGMAEEGTTYASIANDLEAGVKKRALHRIPKTTFHILV